MQIPSDRRYTPDHEWVQIVSTDPDGTRVRVGLSDFAQDQLGDIVYVDLPAEGEAVTAGSVVGELESTKSVSDVFVPVSGEVIARNDALEGTPEVINSDPYGEGWLIKVKVSEENPTEGLLDAEAYAAVVSG